MTLKEISNKSLQKYEAIIYMGGLYASGINGIKKILKIHSKYENLKLIIVGVGITPHRKEDIEKVFHANFSNQNKDSINFFYLRGGFNFNKLNILDKFLMTILKFKISRKKEKSPDEKGMLEAYEKSLDFVKKENLIEILKFLKVK